MSDPDRLEPILSKPTRPRPDPVGALTLRTLLPLAAMVLTAFLATSGQAQEAWVMDKEVSLTLRTGAGTQYRIIGSLTTGNVATILTRGDAWTKVRTAEGKEGWVSAGFLQSSPPARIELERLERDAEDLRKQVAELSEKTVDLRAVNDEIESKDEAQRLEIDQLTRENYRLRARARWPEWITGAGIVLVGMALGALLGRNAGRRRQPRVRL
jgi:SH3 domain protein